MATLRRKDGNEEAAARVCQVEVENGLLGELRDRDDGKSQAMTGDHHRSSVLPSGAMGLSLRRLRIYYMNNVQKSRLMLLCLAVAIVYFLLWPSLFTKKKVSGIVRYRVENTAHRMTDDEIKQMLDSLQDTRPVRCRDQAYDFTRLDVAESVSILSEFNGESFYNLKATLNSIVEHTPFDLYEEIILLDDGTESLELRQHVASYLRDPKFSKVKVYRSEVAEGESASRFKAALLAKGTILIFVSSDSVVNHGWIQPLIAKVSDNERLIAVPHADNLLSENRFYRTDELLVNVMTWSLSTVYSVSDDKQAEMLPSSVMRGDVFAIKASFLKAIGNYDEHMKRNGGGHNLELSLRAWMCGGIINVATCSRIAVHSSLRPQHVADPFNFRRIAELWFEEYKDVVYQQGGFSSSVDPDELRAIELRRGYLRKHVPGCKDFNWYLNNVATDIFPPSSDMKKFGKLRAKTNYCLKQSSGGASELEMTLCRQHMYERSMTFEWNQQGWIFKGDRCLTALDADEGVELQPCEDGNQEQIWRQEDSRLSPMTSAHECLTQVLERDQASLDLFHYPKLKPCGSAEARMQTWEFLNY